MLKRLLFAVTLAAFMLLVAGIATGTAQASDPSVCASGKRVTLTATMAGQPSPPCKWRGDCYICYNYRTASWETQHCEGDSND